MSGIRKRYSSDLKAIRGEKTTNELASEYGVHPSQIAQWKKHALEGLPDLFSTRGCSGRQSASGNRSTQGRVRLVEKNQVSSIEQKRALIDAKDAQVSVARQCELLGLARLSDSYHPVGINEEYLRLMRLLDEQYTRTPFYGTRKMTAWLNGQGYGVERKRVRRLLREMGLETIYPHPHLNQPGEVEQRFPYLLRHVPIDHVNQVWSSDIVKAGILVSRSRIGQPQ